MDNEREIQLAVLITESKDLKGEVVFLRDRLNFRIEENVVLKKKIAEKQSELDKILNLCQKELTSPINDLHLPPTMSTFWDQPRTSMVNTEVVMVESLEKQLAFSSSEEELSREEPSDDVTGGLGDCRITQMGGEVTRGEDYEVTCSMMVDADRETAPSESVSQCPALWRVKGQLQLSSKGKEDSARQEMDVTSQNRSRVTGEHFDPMMRQDIREDHKCDECGFRGPTEEVVKEHWKAKHDVKNYNRIRQQDQDLDGEGDVGFVTFQEWLRSRGDPPHLSRGKVSLTTVIRGKFAILDLEKRRAKPKVDSQVVDRLQLKLHRCKTCRIWLRTNQLKNHRKGHTTKKQCLFCPALVPASQMSLHVTQTHPPKHSLRERDKHFQ